MRKSITVDVVIAGERPEPTTALGEEEEPELVDQADQAEQANPKRARRS